MKYDQHLVTQPADGYELLDSGENMKLERFGDAIVARPETQGLWAKQKPELWESANAVFSFDEAKGAWNVKKPLPDPWVVPHGTLRLIARLTNFKHVGIFPEQAPNWEWTSARIAEKTRAAASPPRVLNLFGYTGAASVAAALAGAEVTHVDSSKQSLDWAHENARASLAREESIRWILDDALAFAKREVRRGAKYDGIILDPPAFGRGGKGEVWKIERDLPALLSALKELLSDELGSFFLLNGYAAGYAPRAFAQAVESVFGELPEAECGELHIQESGSSRVIPAGIYVRFVRE